ncbi:MAG: divergent PAP2 family protein [Firmicutes bacterium]|nr:divergent PAP2 family protein [Bacillota bacterium]
MSAWRNLMNKDLPILQVCFVAWFVAQVLKTVLHAFRHRQLDLRRLVGAGGMPSSHSALVCSLSTAVALKEGIDSTLFAISVVLSLIVMYDAAGVRRAAGRQARILNQMVVDFYQNRELHPERLKELLGHTPYEVLAGALLGIAIPLLYAR